MTFDDVAAGEHMKEKTEAVPYLGRSNAALLTTWLANARARRVIPFLKGRILELGCGSAPLLELETARRSITSYTGVEALQTSVEELKGRFSDHSFLSLDLDSENWPIQGQFDRVLALAVIEHLWNLKSFILNVRHALVDDGLFVLTTPTPYGNYIVLKGLALAGLVRRDVIDDHVAIFNKQLLHHLCEEFGFSLELHRKFQFGGNQLAVIRKLPM